MKVYFPPITAEQLYKQDQRAMAWARREKEIARGLEVYRQRQKAINQIRA